MRKFKKTLCIAMTTLFITTNMNLPIYAEQSNINADGIIPDGVVLNYREMGTLSKSFADEKSVMTPVRGSLPSSYSASTYIPESIDVEQKEDHSSPVKEQNPYGTCWAHSAMGMAESSYIINEDVASDSIDLNEYHLVHHGYGESTDSLDLFGGDYLSNPTNVSILDQGGHNSISLCILANWQGASDASHSTYGDTQIKNGQTPESILGYEDAAHMENAYVISMPDMTTSTYLTDMNIVKQMVKDYGAVGISYYATGDSKYFLACHQYIYDDNLGTNHGVTIVGWNDNISKTAFAKEAPGDGAWLVKNSWGEDWGAGGYFWLSYYDKTIATDGYVFDFVPGDNYDNNYQYDGSGYLYGSISYRNQTCGANAFVADSNETLEAVGFYTKDVNVGYEIKIYRNLEEDALPNSGILVYSQTGQEEYVGYHTVELNEKVPLSEGERYAIVLTLKKSGYAVGMSVDESEAMSWVEFNSYAKAGESYYGYSVDSLQDFNPQNKEYDIGRNVRIKAFTNERTTTVDDVKASSIELNKTNIILTDGNSTQLSASISPINVANLNVDWSTANPLIATVDSKGNVTATGVGTTVVTATTKDGSNLSASCDVRVLPIFVQDINVTENGNSIAVKDICGTGKTFKLGVDIYPSNASIKEVIWTSDNTEVATVNEAGVVTTVGIGCAFITATTKDGSELSDNCCVFVSPILAENMEIVLNGNDVFQLETDDIGKKYDLDVNILPIDTTYTDVWWESSNERVATVDNNGVVTIVGVGNAIITAQTTDGSDISDTCSIIVNEKEIIDDDKDKDDDKEDDKEEDKDVTIQIVPNKPHKITNLVNGVKLEWTEANRTKKFGVWRSETGANGTYQCISITNALTYTDKTTKSGKTYYYQISFYDEATKSHSVKSPVASVTYLSAPKISSVTNITGGIKLNWNKISGATGYVIYCKNNGSGSWKKIANVKGGSKLTYTDKTVKKNNGNVYIYRVCAKKGTILSASQKDKTVARLSTISLKSAKKSGKTAIKCSWSKNNKVTGYKIRLTVGNKVYKTYTIKNSKTASTTIKKLKKGKKYKIQIQTYKTVKGVGTFYSAWSGKKSVKI